MRQEACHVCKDRQHRYLLCNRWRRYPLPGPEPRGRSHLRARLHARVPLLFHLIFAELRANRTAGGDVVGLPLDRLIEDIDGLRQAPGLDSVAMLGHPAHSLLALTYPSHSAKHVSHFIIVAACPCFPQPSANRGRRIGMDTWRPLKSRPCQRGAIQFPKLSSTL